MGAHQRSRRPDRGLLDSFYTPEHPKHGRYRRSCRRKRRFSYSAALSLVRRNGGEVYACAFCSSCHVASPRKRRGKGFREEDA